MLLAGTTIPRQDLMAYLREAPTQYTYIAGRIFPALEVPLRSSKYPTVPTKALWSRQDVRRREDGGYNRGAWKPGEKEWNTQEYGFEEKIDDRKANILAGFIDVEAVAAERVREFILREREFRVRDVVQNETNFPLSGNTGFQVSSAWSDTVNADPIADVIKAQRLGRAGGGGVLRKLQMSWIHWGYWSLNSKIRDRLKYTKIASDLMPLSELASLANLDEIVIGDAQYDSADQGQDLAPSDIWSANYAFLFDTSPTVAGPSIGRSYYWTGDGGGTPDEPTMEEYYMDEVRGRVVRARHEVDESIEHKPRGVLIKVV